MPFTCLHSRRWPPTFLPLNTNRHRFRGDATSNEFKVERFFNEHRGRSALDYKPGDDISDFIFYFVYAGENTTRRAVSEIEQFQSSRCRIASGPGMSCMSCQDPHVSPPPEERVAFFRARCLTCHTQVKYATQHYAANPDCTSRHKPRIGAQNIPHVAWTDHRIRQHPDQPDLVSAPSPAHELIPIFAGRNSPRDPALAYYNLVVIKGLSAERPLPGRCSPLPSNPIRTISRFFVHSESRRS